MAEAYDQYISDDVLAGQIYFKPQHDPVPYLHFAYDADIDNVCYMMTQVWKLPSPQIVLVLISDIAQLTGWQSTKQQEDFIKGLIKGSNATQMWILTYGMNIGISKVIGDALQTDFENRQACVCDHKKCEAESSKITLIGVSQEDLLTYADKFSEPDVVVKLENRGNIPSEIRYDLNPKHSHFMIVRDESVCSDGVNQFLLNLQGYFSEKKDSKTAQVDKYFEAPIIAVLIQGDRQTVNFILAHLKQRFPLLVVKGSGGLADLISFAHYEMTNRQDKVKDTDYVENVLKRSLCNKIVTVFPELKDNRTASDILFKKILDCLKYSEQMGVKYLNVLDMLDLNCKLENLPIHLLKALFKSRKLDIEDFHARKIKDLELTMHWNCPEVATTEVFSKDQKLKIPASMFEDALLRKDREPFVSLFLENDFHVHRHLSSTRLIRLFTQSLKGRFFREICWEGVLGYGQITELDDDFIDFDLNWLLESLTGIPVYISSEKLNICSMGLYGVENDKRDDHAFAERKAIMTLLIWAVLSNRGTLAKILWGHCDEPIMLALYSSLILDKMQPFAHEVGSREHIKQLSREFAAMATGVFDSCYENLRYKAYAALNEKNAEWRKHSLIDIASFAENRTFLSHPCCQRWLTNMFLGNIKFRELTWGFLTFPLYVKVLLSAFFVFPMYLWVRFENEDTASLAEQDSEISDPYYTPETRRELKTQERRNAIGRLTQIDVQKYSFPSLKEMIYSMWTAPISVFWVSIVFYMIYLALFSLTLIWPSCGNLYLDIVVCSWTALISADCAYRIYSLHKAFPNMPMFLRCVELFYMVLFTILYLMFRIINGQGQSDPYAAKILLSAALLYFYYRMIFLYLPISSTLGPLLYRVHRMVSVDFVNFMRLALLVMISNGIAMHAMLYPDYPLCSELWHQTFFKAWQAFFVTPLDGFTGKDAGCVHWYQKPSNATFCRISTFTDYVCADPGMLPYLMVFQYLIFFKLILLTVLFALFNNTGAKLQAESDSLWKFQRYHLIVNFAYGFCLPPPLNVFSIILMLWRSLKSVFTEKGTEPKTVTEEKSRTAAEFDYWKDLAFKYFSKEEDEKHEMKFEETEFEKAFELTENVSSDNEMILKLKNQITELRADVAYTHTSLETCKCRTVKEDEADGIVPVHVLARETPYPKTKIQRFPVPEKYVPWEVSWLHYQPAFYTMPYENFSKEIQKYADEDMTQYDDEEESMTQKTAYNWNADSCDEEGVFRDRKSWIIDNQGEPISYELDHNKMPRNPMGRTGLVGKGALPRWGPNHNIFTVITRPKAEISEDKDLEFIEDVDLEFIVFWFARKNDLQLPGGFAWEKSRYEPIRSMFINQEDKDVWTSCDQMISFFKSCIVEPSNENNEMSSDDGEEKDDASKEEKDNVSKEEMDNASKEGKDDVSKEEKDNVSKDEKDTASKDGKLSDTAHKSGKDGSSFECRKVFCGYMDDSLNTDQAWKEVELWHMHYKTETMIAKMFKHNADWRMLSEEVFTQFPHGQAALLQDAIRHLKGAEQEDEMNFSGSIKFASLYL